MMRSTDRSGPRLQAPGRVVKVSVVEQIDPSAFACPRCKQQVEEERFYGPCASCRAELRAQYASDGRVVELAEYEPKLNVTPNAVATKDD
jgi:hypothetical protein